MHILEIEILSDNIDETNFFYSKILGFETIDKNESSISFLAGTSILKFKKSFKQNPIYHFAFNIPNNQLEEAMKWAASKVDLLNVEEDNLIADFKRWNAKAFYFYDNNQNVLEFIARFDLENQAANTFEVSSIQSISEIGIVTDNVIELSNKLIKEQNISVFENGTIEETFATIGDNNGLFIIVPPNRNWFPTNKQQSVKFFTRVKLSVDGNTQEIIFNEKSNFL